MKKVSCVALALFLMMSFCVTTSATTPSSTDTISIAEYEAAIQAECAKYGIECRILDYDPNLQITQEMLNRGIENARNYAESLLEQKQPDLMPSIRDGNSNIDNNQSPLGIMPLTQDYIAYFRIYNTYGSADMAILANITTNLANGLVMSVNSTSVYQYGSFVNFVSWETTGVSSTRNSPKNGYVTFKITGRATFSYADPVTSITTGYTSYETKTVQMNCT